MSALIVAFRRLLYLFHDVEKGRRRDGRHTFCTYGAGGDGRISVGWHTADTQRSPTCWDPYLSLSVPGRNRNAQLSLHQQLDRRYCHGHIHVVKPRRVLVGPTLGVTPPLPVTPYHEYMYRRRRTQIGAIQCGSLNVKPGSVKIQASF